MRKSFALLFLFGLLLLTACENDLADLKKIADFESSGIDKAKNVEILYSDSALVRARIKGPIMMVYLDPKNPRREFPNGVSVDFFEGSTQPSSFMTAKQATQYEKQRKVLLKDSVVVWNINNEQLETNELIWDDAAQRIFSDKFVKITTPKEVIYGYGFFANSAFTYWEIDSVSGVFSTQDFQDILD